MMSNSKDKQTKKKPANEQEDQDVKKFNYLLGMSMWMLTDEKKSELLKQRDQKLFEYDTLKKKTCRDLWKEDLDEFMDKLTQIEKKELDEEKSVKKEKKTMGKKKMQHFETMPSPMAQRVAPTISMEMRKKIEYAKRYKENKGTKGKRTKKGDTTPADEEDEFDLMCKDKKTLADKVGSPDDIGKKGNKKGLKQTKLVFPKKEKTSPKSKKEPFSGDDFSENDESDEEFKTSITSQFGRERTARRAATKPVKYSLSDEEEDEVFGRKRKTSFSSSESEDEKKKTVAKMESSEDMFDQLVGRKKDSDQNGSIENGSIENGSPDIKPISKAHQMSSELFNSDSDAMEEESRENHSIESLKRKKKSESDEDVLPKKKIDNGKTKGKPGRKKKDDDEAKPGKKGRKKKVQSDSDSDDFERKISKPLKKSKKKADSDSDDIFDGKISGNGDDEERAAAKREARPGRNAAKSKYVFDDDSDFSE